MAKAIAFFGLQFEAENCSLVEKLIHRAEELGFEALVEEKYLAQLGQCQLSKTVKPFSTKDDLHAEVELMISLGGDGTMLRAVTYIGHKNIPKKMMRSIINLENTSNMAMFICRSSMIFGVMAMGYMLETI